VPLGQGAGDRRGQPEVHDQGDGAAGAGDPEREHGHDADERDVEQRLLPSHAFRHQLAVREQEEGEDVRDGGHELETVVDGLDEAGRLERLVDAVGLQVEHCRRAHHADGEEQGGAVLGPQPHQEAGERQVEQAEGIVEGERSARLRAVRRVGHRQRDPVDQPVPQAALVQALVQRGRHVGPGGDGAEGQDEQG